MSTVKLTHEHETKIALYCMHKGRDFKFGNAHDIVMETFKDNPIMETIKDEKTNTEKQVCVTQRIARSVECQKNCVERISDRIDDLSEKYNKFAWNEAIKKAKENYKPDLVKLVDNLYKLNIVDEASYLALVCNLMQIWYTRDKEFVNDEKTCVFFNGVAHNGKSATAKAICEVEAQYGDVYRALSGKILSSPHEERAFKSHVNFFDELKPTDINRELLLGVINGGTIELNPKGKKPYLYNTNSNYIFTSNDNIYQNQRRFSVIKFGDKLYDNSVSHIELVNIIKNIMDSLPSFDHYSDLYKIVAYNNEHRINPLAVEAVITFLNSKFGFVNETDQRKLESNIVFSPYNIYNCIKDTYNKQIIPSERRDAINNYLKSLEEKGLITELKDKKYIMTNYRVTAEDYLKIVAEYQKINTNQEVNLKITKTALYDCLAPFFDNIPQSNNGGLTSEDDNLPNNDNQPQCDNQLQGQNQPNGNNQPQDNNLLRANNQQQNRANIHDAKPIILDAHDLSRVTYSLVKLADEAAYRNITGPNDKQILVTADTKAKGTMLLYHLLKQMHALLDTANVNSVPFDSGYTMEEALEKYLTEDICRCVSYQALVEEMEAFVTEFGEEQAKFVKELYMQRLGVTDEKNFEVFEQNKLQHLPVGAPDYLNIESSWNFNCRKYAEAQKQKKLLQAQAHKEKLERERQRKAELARIKQEEKLKQSSAPEDDNKKVA